jgi:hypothetical protein
MPKLTIGMAHYDDYHGAYFTIQALRLYHPEVIKDIQFVVIDNSPHTQHGSLLKGFVEGAARRGTAGAKYIPLTDPKGTSPSRNAIFDHADGDFVLVNDCHVMYPSGSIKRLLDYYQANPKTNNIYSGPLVYDGMDQVTTHFNDEWRGEMWGTWGSAWTNQDETEYFSIIQDPSKKDQALPIALEMGQKPIMSCAGKQVPHKIAWAGHPSVYKDAGFKLAGVNDDDKPFEIPGQGLGSFTCRRAAWLGFNPHSRGFGGEELYIHEKYRQQGGKAICLPFLKWVHRFGRPDGPKYPLTRYGKVRNYVLEFNELGRELDPIHEHFVSTGLLLDTIWDRLIEDPIKNELEEKEEGEKCSPCEAARKIQGSTLEEEGAPVEKVFEIVSNVKRDLDEHLEFLRDLASDCKHITEISKRKESFVAFAAAKPKTLVSHNIEPHSLMDYMEAILPGTKIQRTTLTTELVEPIEKTDLLFIDTRHTFGVMTNELKKHASSVRRYIVARGTGSNGERGEDGGPGILFALREFMKENPEWSVITHRTNQYGMTVLGRLKKDKPKLPSKIKMAKNFALAVKDHIKTGSESASKEVVEDRLSLCSICEFRNDDQCSLCGCFLAKKASWAESNCPIGKWAGDNKET